MSTAARRGGAAFAFFLAAAVVSGLALGTGHGQPPVPLGGAKKSPKWIPDDKELVITDPGGCVTCHKEGDRNDLFGEKGTKSTSFIYLTESRTWTQEDPHSRAYQVLETPRGKMMSDILKYDIRKAVQCLVCHATDMRPAKLLSNKTDADFDKSIGVACNTCHGLRAPWQQQHTIQADDPQGGRTVPWRTLTPDDKAELGLRNLRDPVVKAEFCATCHVGSQAEGKVVTHEMYAAGHPPLPPFELATFMENQPKHWGYPTDPKLSFFTRFDGTPYKSNKKLDNWQWELYRFHPPKQEVYLARQMAAGAIAGLQAEMNLLAQDAKAHADGGLVDFARFDCYACHHDLQYPSPRQKRGYEWTPGRPTLKAWTAALPGVIAEHAKGLPKFTALAGEFDARWKKVEEAATARPFGKPDDLAAAAAGMADWCHSFLAAQQSEAKPVYTPEQAAKLAAMVAAAAQSDRWSADPEAAMHLTWAYLAIRSGPNPVPPDQLKRLGETVAVKLRYPPYSNNKGQPYSVGERLEERADRFRKYDAKAFRAAFQDVVGNSK